jgi:hypothetical protein
MTMKFPGGHVEYSFEMFIEHSEPINFNNDDSRIKEIVITKSVPNDPFDYKWKLVMVCSEVSSIKEVDCIGEENKENIFNLISFMLNTGINEIRQTGHGVIPREGEGAQCHMIMPAMTCHGVAKNGGRKLNRSEIQALGEILIQSKRLKNHPLVNLFSYAIRIDEPVVQFMLLYLILYEIFKNQKSIDKYIMKVSPSTLQVPSPHNNKPETIYTKLRNEITHRVDNSPRETRSGIIGNTHKLKCIVHTAIMAEIKK